MATGESRGRGKIPGRGNKASREKSPGKGKSPISTLQEWPKTREGFVEWFWSGTNGNELIEELNCSKFRGDYYIGREKEWSKTRKEFVEWFWSGTNGNELIKELNCSESHGDDYIRREKERPTIYGIVLNVDLFPKKEGEVQWKLCKVGFTHKNTATGTGNRMEQVRAEIQTKYNSNRAPDRKAKADMFFVLPIGAVDVTKFSDTEKRIRNAVGRPIRKDVAKTFRLACPTEWVFTTQQFIDKIKAQIEKLKAEDSTDLIDLFKNLKFKDVHKKPSWVTLDDVDGVRTVIGFDSSKLKY